MWIDASTMLRPESTPGPRDNRGAPELAQTDPWAAARAHRAEKYRNPSELSLNP